MTFEVIRLKRQVRRIAGAPIYEPPLLVDPPAPTSWWNAIGATERGIAVAVAVVAAFFLLLSMVP